MACFSVARKALGLTPSVLKCGGCCTSLWWATGRWPPPWSSLSTAAANRPGRPPEPRPRCGTGRKWSPRIPTKTVMPMRMMRNNSKELKKKHPINVFECQYRLKVEFAFSQRWWFSCTFLFLVHINHWFAIHYFFEYEYQATICAFNGGW